jgi:hypothetical protein
MPYIWVYSRSFHYAVLKRLPQDLEDMSFELGQLVEIENAAVHQGHLYGHGDLATADQADVGNSVGREGVGW